MNLIKPISPVSLALRLSIFLLATFALAAGAGQPGQNWEAAWPFETVQLPPEALTLDRQALAERADRPRVPLLQRIHQAHQERDDWRAKAERHLIRVDDDRLLLEIRLAPNQQRVTSSSLARRTGLEIHAQNVPSLFDAWVPVGAIADLLASEDVISLQPAREVRTLRRFDSRAGSVTSEGVAASGMGPYHALGADGEGTIIALIDSNFVGWEDLQASGDWPPNAQLRRFVIAGTNVFECTGSGDPPACSNFDSGGTHGSSTMEIAYDMAPGANFWVYQSTLVSSWYAGLLHASDTANHGGFRADIFSASLGAPLDGIGDGSECPPLWGNPCGTIAEAAGIAAERGTLVVNAAGNSREEHWGGLYDGNGVSPGGDYVDSHRWTPGGGNLNQSPACLPEGFPIQITAFWNDWTDINHDYDLFLFRRNAANNQWEQYASSTSEQSGDPSQDPQEFISVGASGSSGNCPSGLSNYALMVARWSAPTARNLQVFSNIGFFDFIPERSLGFPADSPNVFTVGALNASGNFDQQSSFSSEGPVLAPGGGLPPPTDVDKPDGMNFSGVSTVTDDPITFTGTSAATPHVAGIAAVLNQLSQAKPAQTVDNPADALHLGLALVGLDGDNDLCDSGHDTIYGYGRIRLRDCTESITISAETWHQVALPCERLAGNTVAQTFGMLGMGTYGSDWMMWRWDPSSGGYSPLPNDSAALDIAESYWLYSFNAGSGTISGLPADITAPWPVDTTGAAGLGRPYMLSNPRRFDLDWNQLRFFYDGDEHDFITAVNDEKVRNFMWTWDPGTETYSEHNGILGEGELGPGEPFWVRVTDDVQVRFPVTATPASSPLTAGRLADSANWMTQAILETDSEIASIRFGHHTQASDDFDHFDAERLTSPASPVVTMAIPQPGWGEHSADYARDIRSPKARDTWTFKIEATERARARLHLDDPDGRLAASYLVDERTGRRIPVRDLGRTGYALNLDPGERILHLVYRAPR